MPQISRASMYGKLNSLLYRSLESGTDFCKLRSNPCLRLEHWLHQVFEFSGNDLEGILRHQRSSVAAVKTELSVALDRLPMDNESILQVDQLLENATERGWMHATLMFRSTTIRSGHLLVGLLRTPSLYRALQSTAPTLAALDGDRVINDFAEATASSVEHDMAAYEASSFGLTRRAHQRDLFIFS